MDEAQIGYDSSFERGSGSPLLYAEIARVTEIKPPSLSRGTADVTHLKSPRRWKEFIAAMRDGGEVSFTVVYSPESATQAQLLADFNDDEAHPYRVVFPNSVKHAWSFPGIITGIETAIPIEDKMSQSFTVKVAGKPTFAATLP